MTPKAPKSIPVTEALSASLSFFELFGLALPIQKISKQLLFVKASPKQIQKALSQFTCKKGFIAKESQNKFWEDFFEKQRRAATYWKRVHRYRWLFQICPFIEFTAVCNSLPLNNVNKNSDIDLFILTQNDKLFTARFFVSLMTQILGVRRHGKHTKKRFCLSFYASKTASNFQNIAHKPKDIYLAYWINTLELISGNTASHEYFLNKNQWLKAYFPKTARNRSHFKEANTLQKSIKRSLEFLFKAKFIENILQNHQLKRARRKSAQLKDNSGTILSKTMLKFHDHDKRQNIQERWIKTVEKHGHAASEK